MGDGAGRLRWGLGAAAAVVLYALFVRLVGMPLHAAEFGQPVIGYLNGLGWVLQAPGSSAAFQLHTSDSPYTLTTWSPAWPSTCRSTSSSACSPTVSGRARAPPRPPRRCRCDRRFLKAGLRVAGAGAVVGLGYAFAEPRWYGVTRRTFRLRDLPPSLDGLRLVQLSDIHHGPWLSLGHVREVVRACNALRPDLVLLTGDYILHSSAYVRPVVEELAQLRPAVGTVAVLGNHDWTEARTWCGASSPRPACR